MEHLFLEEQAQDNLLVNKILIGQDLVQIEVDLAERYHMLKGGGFLVGPNREKSLLQLVRRGTYRPLLTLWWVLCC